MEITLHAMDWIVYLVISVLIFIYIKKNQYKEESMVAFVIWIFFTALYGLAMYHFDIKIPSITWTYRR